MTTTKRTPVAISESAEDFGTKVRTALLKSVDAGQGVVRVKVSDPDDKVNVRKIQKRIQGIGYSAGFNANFGVTRTGDILTGTVLDLTRDRKGPGETDPTPKTPGTRQTFVGWTPKKISAWKTANPVGSDRGKTSANKVTKKTPTTKGGKTTAKRRNVTKVTKVPTGPVTVPDALKGLVSAGPVDTSTVTVTSAK